MKIYEETYGCTMNQGDTELMLGRLREAGHQIVHNIEESEIVLLNTCAVKRTTLNRMLHRLKELREGADQKIIVGGCLPLIDPEKVDEDGDFAGIISCRTTDSVEEVVERISRGEGGIKKIWGRSDKTLSPKFRRDEISAPVAIAEGCVSDCSYCCVKFARGRLRSFGAEKIIEVVRGELKAGRREILLTSQDTAAYGLDGGRDLPHLLKKIASIPDKFRVRVGMMNPKQAKKIMPELLESFDNDRVYKFLHLPVQSGNDGVLREMRRGYGVQDFKDIVDSFRGKFPKLYLATDIIVGFPGESNEAFEDSCRLIEELRPDKVNLTRFTPMPGTAAKERKQIDSGEKKRRSRKLSSIQREIGYERNLEYEGLEAEGLVVGEGKKGGYIARLPNYKPVVVENAKPRDFVKIKITEAEPTYLRGRIER